MIISVDTEKLTEKTRLAIERETRSNDYSEVNIEMLSKKTKIYIARETGNRQLAKKIIENGAISISLGKRICISKM